MTFDNKGTNKGIKLYKPKFFDKNHCISIWYAFDSDPAQAPNSKVYIIIRHYKALILLKSGLFYSLYVIIKHHLILEF